MLTNLTRALLLFATLLAATMVAVFFFVGAIVGYIIHGARRDTENQFEHPVRGTGFFMALLILGEMGGFAVVLAGFIVGQLL